MGGSRGLLTVVLAAAAAGTCLPAAALAATAGSDLTKLNFEAGAGEANRVVVTWDGVTVSVRDPGAPLVLGCIPAGLDAVVCTAPAGNPLTRFGGCDACTARILTGDGDDTAQVVNAPQNGLRVLLDGGDGADTLSSDAGLGTVLGGAGDDTLSGHDAEGGPGDDRLLGTAGDDGQLAGGPGADTLTGGDGTDTATYRERGEAVRVTLGSGADDGAAGERDDVRTENVTGGAGDDVLTGDGAANELDGGAGGDRLSGAGGTDTLLGGPGRDTLDGGAGDDTLLSFANAPGVVDDVACAGGDDIVQASHQDHVALDCEHVYFGATPVPRLQIDGAARMRARNGVLRLALTAHSEEEASEAAGRPPPVQPPDGPAITASATLAAVRGTPRGVLARARPASFAAPGSTPLRLRLTPRARRELARRGAIRMRVTITARDADGNESLTRRILVVRR
jgi:hypothetical protein